MTILQNEIKNRKVLSYVDGQYAPSTKNSNLYKAIVKLKYTPDDIGSKIDIAIGAKRQRVSEGYKMAIVKI